MKIPFKDGGDCQNPAQCISNPVEVKSKVIKKRPPDTRLRLESLKSLEWALGGIIHEFNNVFSVILSNMELAQMKAPENIGGYIEKTLESVRRGKQVINRLTYSVADAGRPMLVDIGLLARQMAEILGNGKRVKASIKTTSGLWKIFGNPVQIQLMLMSLFINIRESFCGRCENGFPVISVAAENVILPPESIKVHCVIDEFVRLSFSWNGNEAHRQETDGGFEPIKGQKCENRAVADFSLAREIISSLGGWMETETKPGPGGQIKIFLPGQQEENEDQPAAGALKGGCEAILLVEDERNMAEAIKELLESLGYSVFIALNGKEALRVFDEKSPLIDMAILDLVLPDTSGLEVLKQIRRIKPEIKVILSSATGGSNVTAGAPGAFDFISKPYNFEHLAHIIRESFGGDETGALDIKNHVNRIRSYFVREKTMPYEKLSDGLSFFKIFGKLAGEPREKFLAVFLDTGKNLIAYDVISHGTTDEAVVYPQEIVRSALLAGAAFIALVHNHPSGILKPSTEDVRLTLNVKTICRLLRIELADHVIIGKSGYFSFAEKNML